MQSMNGSMIEAVGAPQNLKQGACFDYAALAPQKARSVRVSTERIRQLVRRSLNDVVEIGAELISVKQTLPHGHFLPWLHTEFGWRERSARNFMNVAIRFKSARVADLEMDVTAAYLLAAPSTPERARTLALERSENGEHITYALAQEIVAQARNNRRNDQATHHAPRARKRTLKALDRLRHRWPAEEAKELARLLREFADSLESTSETR
jgi:hypothetical protein